MSQEHSFFVERNVKKSAERRARVVGAMRRSVTERSSVGYRSHQRFKRIRFKRIMIVEC
jgi:hypothetical protein